MCFVHIATLTYNACTHVGEAATTHGVLISFISAPQAGVYSEWSRFVVVPTAAEKRNNPRSKCCKLRWCVRADDGDEA